MISGCREMIFLCGGMIYSYGTMVFLCGGMIFLCGTTIFLYGEMIFQCGVMIFSCSRITFTCCTAMFTSNPVFSVPTTFQQSRFSSIYLFLIVYGKEFTRQQNGGANRPASQFSFNINHLKFHVL
jgi:hypothetical protein